MSRKTSRSPFRPYDKLDEDVWYNFRKGRTISTTKKKKTSWNWKIPMWILWYVLGLITLITILNIL